MKGEITSELLEAMGFIKKEDETWYLSYGETMLLGTVTINLKMKHIEVYASGCPNTQYGGAGFSVRTLLGVVQEAGSEKGRRKVGNILAEAFREMHKTLPEF